MTPNWIMTLISAVLGSSILGVLLTHLFQQQRERVKEKHAQHTAWIAHQREVCAELLEIVIRQKEILRTLESLHDNRAARLTMKKTLEGLLQDTRATAEPIRKVRRELDLHPNAQLQEAIDHYGDAAIAYYQALYRPMSSVLNPVQFYTGKTPKDELAHLSQEFNVRTQELQEATRKYMAQLEHEENAKRPWWAFWRARVK